MYLSLHIEVLSFEDSEWSSGRYKIECQVEKLEHFPHILLFEFNREAKALRRPENFAPCIGTIPSERAWQENGFHVLKRIVLTLVTLHIQEDLRGLMEIV